MKPIDADKAGVNATCESNGAYALVFGVALLVKTALLTHFGSRAPLIEKLR
jgi:hypothetical protein